MKRIYLVTNDGFLQINKLLEVGGICMVENFFLLLLKDEQSTF